MSLVSYEIFSCDILCDNKYELCVIFFFFKQKTAYEMRISDWSSDVCSSDLITDLQDKIAEYEEEQVQKEPDGEKRNIQLFATLRSSLEEIGRASCRERVCQYV